MLKFKTYLNEGRDAPLYHGTSQFSALQILKSNRFLSNVGNNSISFTRKFKLAARWSGIAQTVVFEVDQRKLSQRFKIKPYNYFNQEEGVPLTRRPEGKSGLDTEKENEYEEVVKGTINNADKFITAIHISKMSYRTLQKANNDNNGQFYNLLITHKLLAVDGVFINRGNK